MPWCSSAMSLRWISVTLRVPILGSMKNFTERWYS